MNNSEGPTLWDLLFPNRLQVSWEAFAITFEAFFQGKYASSCLLPDIPVRRLLDCAIVHENAVVTKKAFMNFVQLFGPVR